MPLLFLKFALYICVLFIAFYLLSLIHPLMVFVGMAFVLWATYVDVRLHRKFLESFKVDDSQRPSDADIKKNPRLLIAWIDYEIAMITLGLTDPKIRKERDQAIMPLQCFLWKLRADLRGESWPNPNPYPPFKAETWLERVDQRFQEVVQHD